MKVHCHPIRDEQLTRPTEEPSDWGFAIPPWSFDPPKLCSLGHDHYLWSSPNGQVWAFAAVDSKRNLEHEPSSDDLKPGQVEFMLFDPPVQSESTIRELFFRLHLARIEEENFGPERADEIAAATAFPNYRTVADQLPGAPEGWLDLKVGLGHGFELSEGAYISEETWDAYTCDSLEDALRNLVAPRACGILVKYALWTPDVIPLLQWNLDWPLSRRGDAAPAKRGAVQGDLPWEEDADRGLLTVYQWAPCVGSAWTPHYDMKPMLRLSVGGRTQEDAEANWHCCAKALRRIKRGLEIPNKCPLD